MTYSRTMKGGRRRRSRRASGRNRRYRTRGALASAKKSYARRVRSSVCRGKGPAVCRSNKRCKYASGRKRSFCRKSKSTSR